MAFENELGNLDFARCEEYASTLTNTELAFAAKDARETARVWDACPHDESNVSGKYWDEFYTYADVLRARGLSLQGTVALFDKKGS
jgi:hypothetical protein